MNIEHKKVYEVQIKKDKFWILILYDISGYHYVGLRVLQKPSENTIKIKSIKKYVDLYGIREYKYSMVKRPVYIKGKALEINDSELSDLFNKCKEYTINYLNHNVNANKDGVSYLKWCKDKYILNNKNDNTLVIKQGAIYWINMGYGVGSELRKIRPAIVWRKSSDNKMCSIIPLTSKNYGDKHYFHYDISVCENCTAKIEYLQNLSSRRLLSPYYKKDRMCFISNNDKTVITKIIERYYLFK